MLPLSYIQADSCLVISYCMETLIKLIPYSVPACPVYMIRSLTDRDRDCVAALRACLQMSITVFTRI